MPEAGTSTTAYEYVILIGNKAASKKVYLTGFFTDIESDTYQDLLIETKESLGDVQVVVIGIEGGFDNAWFMQYTGVYNLSYDADKKGIRFPCYHWINKDKSVTTTSKSSKLHEKNVN